MLISSVFKWSLVLVTIVNTCSALEESHGAAESARAGSNGGAQQKHVVKRNAERQRSRRNRNRWANFRRINSNESSWLSFTPPTPNPEEVDCYIEVEVRRTVDGRCVRLGGQSQSAVCQSGIHLDFFNNDCETILAHREGGANGAGAGVTSQSQHPGGSSGGAGGK